MQMCLLVACRATSSDTLLPACTRWWRSTIDIDMVFWRLLHIVSGVIWAGVSLFLAFVMEPRLRALGHAVQQTVMRSMAGAIGVTFASAGTVNIVSGIVLIFVLRGNSLDTLHETGWGWAMALGLVTTVAAYVLNLATIRTNLRMREIGKTTQGRQPTVEEMGEIQGLSSRLRISGQATAILLLIAVGAMASARFV